MSGPGIDHEDCMIELLGLCTEQKPRPLLTGVSEMRIANREGTRNAFEVSVSARWGGRFV